MLPTTCLLALCSAVHVGALLIPTRPLHARALRSRPVLLSAADDEGEGELSDDALAAAFKARLDAEGGATQFKIKTTISNAADELKSGASGIADSTKGIAETGADGLLNASAWQLLLGFFAATVLFAFINAGARSEAPDRYTSDGGALEFGKRAEVREMPYQSYQPQLGVGTE